MHYLLNFYISNQFQLSSILIITSRKLNTLVHPITRETFLETETHQEAVLITGTIQENGTIKGTIPEDDQTTGDITVKVMKTGTTHVDAPTRTTSMDTMNTGTTPTIAAMLTTYIDGLTREDSIIHMTDQEGTPLQDITVTTRLPGNPAPVVVSHVQVDHIVLLLIPDAQTVTNSTIFLECADSQNQPQKHSTIHMSNTTNRDTRLSLTRIGTTLTNHLL